MAALCFRYRFKVHYSYLEVIVKVFWRIIFPDSSFASWDYYCQLPLLPANQSSELWDLSSTQSFAYRPGRTSPFVSNSPHLHQLLGPEV